ncbi:MAG TPA: ferrous iron transport protein B [Bacteroidales bacterium]|nr:ferrous iron transport protein B [Bacteroidales bacterium]
MNSHLKLSEVETGESVYIIFVKGKGAFRQRLGEMGFVKGKRVTVVKNAPLNDPIEFSILGYNISLRRNEASLIEVSTDKIEGIHDEQIHPEFLQEAPEINRQDRIIRVAMVGNPNSGKTTIYNYASKSREHVGNYTGVTVSSKTATFKVDDTVIHLTDLPGTYSVSAYSPEELFVREFIVESKPDVVVNVIDAANLERNLFLTTQLIDMNVKVVVALNMFDELLKLHDHFDYLTLGSMLGIPFVPTIGARGKGINKLFRKVIDVYNGRETSQRYVKINYGTEIEQSITRITGKLNSGKTGGYDGNLSPRFLALRLLGRDSHVEDLMMNSPVYESLTITAREESARIEHLMSDTVESVITDARYGFISGALKETYKPGTLNRRKVSDGIDNLLTNRYLGFPVFLLFMWVMFSATFNLGAYPQQWIENGVALLSSLINEHMAAGSFKDLLTDGIIGGVGGVIVFLPNILILFFFISIMEDTGYMARAAFITDKLMHKIGLHGKSFIPLIMGFGCNVPAIMATRTIENRSNRLLTILINPFMSCSARLPVYILLIGAVFPSFKGTLLFSIYLIGIIMAVGVALVFKKTLFKSSDAPFVMELPPYRLPTIRSVTKHMWMKASQYLRKMGGIILIASVLIWALGYFPVQKTEKQAQQTSSVQNSYIARIGKTVQPVIAPLGFDWKMGVCLITGIAAKEIVVSTMGVIYSDDHANSSVSLEQRISASGEFTIPATLSFLVFTLLYFPCLATLTAIYNETGSVKWPLFSLTMTTALAWIASFITFNIAVLFV